MIKLRLLCIPIIMGSFELFSQVPMTADFSSKNQTIDGFGCFSAINDNWSSKSDANFVKNYINDLGATISRQALSEKFENVNDNADPNITDLSKFNLESMRWEFDYWKTIKAASSETKFIISIWTPPVWQKENGHACGYGGDFGTCGGRLRYDMYEEFAERCVAFIKILKQQTGIDLYAFSLQNELAFDQPFVSCVYTPQEYVNLIKVVGPRFKKEGITTKIFGPEDIGWYDRVMQYINGSLNDATAKQYIDIIAIHGYASNGVSPNSPDAITWKNMSTPGFTQGKPFWMTETSGYGNEFTDAMSLGKAIYTALKWGKTSGWVWWQASRNPTHPEALWNSTINYFPPKYYASKQYYRYIRPGAVGIEINSTDASLLPLAFHHATEKTMTYVIINNGTTTKSISLVNNNANPATMPTQYAIYRTSSTENTASIGNVASTGTVTLPANSITTLYGTYGVTGIDYNSDIFVKTEVFPNPASESITIDMNLEREAEVKISLMDVVGKEINVIAVGRMKSYYDTQSIQNLSKGIYFVNFQIEGKPTKTKKLIVD